MKKGITVLMYHALSKEGVFDADKLNPADRSYLLSAETFAEQLDMLDRNRIMVAVPASIVSEMSAINIANAALSTYDESFLLTFDDCWQSHLTVALPLLEKYKFKAIFFLTAEQIEKKNMLTKKNIRELSERGVVIGSHGAKHCFFDDLDAYRLRNELSDSKKILSDLIGKDVHTLALPGGRDHPELIKIAGEEGYSHIFGSCPGCWKGNEKIIPRIPVKENFEMNEFEMLIDEPEKFCRNPRLSYTGKKILRKIIGNSGYEKLRSFIKGEKSA